MEMWKKVVASEFIEFNPKEKLKKGTIAPKISMDVLVPFTRKISSYSQEPYNGGIKFRNQDTIMARITPCLENGKTSMVNILPDRTVGFGSTEYIVFRARPGISDPKFVYYLACSNVIRDIAIKSMVGSSGRQRVQQTVVNNIEFMAPELEEQKRIAVVLSSLDDKIELNNAINENLEQQAQAIFKSWFVDFEPFDGDRPYSWQESDIYSIANIIYGAPFASKLFNTEKNGVPVIRIRDLKAQSFATYTTEVHPKGYLLQKGDIVVGMDGEFRPYIWGNDNAWLNQRVCVFKNKRKNGKAFLLFTLKPLLHIIEQTQVATTVIHIGKKEYDAFRFFLPDETTLTKFDQITSPMIENIVSNSIENKRLALLRDILLPKLMSGEIDVSNIKL